MYGGSITWPCICQNKSLVELVLTLMARNPVAITHEVQIRCDRGNQEVGFRIRIRIEMPTQCVIGTRCVWRPCCVAVWLICGGECIVLTIILRACPTWILPCDGQNTGLVYHPRLREGQFMHTRRPWQESWSKTTVVHLRPFQQGMVSSITTLG